MSAPTPTPRRHPARAALLAVLAWVLLVVVAGGAWWLLAPQPEVATDGRVRIAPGLTELDAAQDGWFTLLTAAAGLVTGLLVLRRRDRLGAPAVLTALVASTLGALAVRALGGALSSWRSGPRSPALSSGVRDRLAEGVQAVPSGLELHATVALVAWPLLSALVVTLALMLVLMRSAPDDES